VTILPLKNIFSGDTVMLLLTIKQVLWHLVFASLRELVLVSCTDLRISSSKEQFLSYIQ